MITERPTFVIRLRPERGVDAVHALRRLLKFALRSCQMRALDVREEHDKAAPTVTTSTGEAGA
jgi:hypothetical protein